MRKILIGFLVIGTCGIANSSPVLENSTPTFLRTTSSTDKISNEAHSSATDKKVDKDITPTMASISTNTILPEDSRSVTQENSGKGIGATVATLKEPTNQADMKESTTLIPVQKGEKVSTLPSNQKHEEKENKTIPPKVESKNPSMTVLKETTTIRPFNGVKEQIPNNKEKTSIAYLDRGKVVIFNGICGSHGCEVEGDIYDELVPLPHVKKQG